MKPLRIVLFMERMGRRKWAREREGVAGNRDGEGLAASRYRLTVILNLFAHGVLVFLANTVSAQEISAPDEASRIRSYEKRLKKIMEDEKAGKNREISVFDKVTPEWSVILAKVESLKEESEPNEPFQKGFVKLKVMKTLFGKEEENFDLPYDFLKMSLFKRGGALEKQSLPGYPEQFTWPELKFPSEDLFLVLVNPRGDFWNVTSQVRPIAEIALKVSGENDEMVATMLGRINARNGGKAPSE
jgi:hypothetical protein